MNLGKIWDIFDTNSDMELDIKEENAAELSDDPTKKIHV